MLAKYAKHFKVNTVLCTKNVCNLLHVHFCTHKPIPQQSWGPFWLENTLNRGLRVIHQNIQKQPEFRPKKHDILMKTEYFNIKIFSEGIEPIF